VVCVDILYIKRRYLSSWCRRGIPKKGGGGVTKGGRGEDLMLGVGKTVG
jgi:hypothetical protein